jgi:hypothetical protein
VSSISLTPKLHSDSARAASQSFFRNKGAVTGVFVVVGVAATAIIASVLFWFRRARRRRVLDHDTALAAARAEVEGRNFIDPGDDAYGPTVGSGSIADTGRGSPPSATQAGRGSPPSATYAGINTMPISTGGYGWQPSAPTYLPDNFDQAYDPYRDNQAPYRNVAAGPSNFNAVPISSLPSGSSGLPFLSHSQQDSLGSRSTDPLLGPVPESDASPEPAMPPVPPRNPMRLMGGTRDRHGSADRRDNGGNLYGGNAGYQDDEDEDEAPRRRSLKVRQRVDPITCGVVCFVAHDPPQVRNNPD